MKAIDRVRRGVASAVLWCVVTPSLGWAAPEAVPAGTKRLDAIVYATRGDNQAHVLSATDLSVLGSIELGIGAHELAVSGDGRWLMGSAYGGPGAGHQPADKRLVVADLSTGRVHTTIDLGALSRPNDIAFLPSRSEAIVTVEVPPRVLRVDASAGTYEAIEIERKTGHMLALAPDARSAFVAHVMPGGVTVLNLETRKVESVIDVPVGAEGIACSLDGKSLWVACNRSDKIVVIDTHERKVARVIACEGFPFRLRFAPDGKLVAVSCPKSGDVALIDPSDAEKLRRISVQIEGAQNPSVPTSLAFAPDGKTLAVLCDGGDAGVVLIDASAGKVLHRRAADGAIPDALTSARIMWPAS